MLKPFGCLAYAANLVPHRGKFDSRSIKCAFIGYDISHKGFLMLDLTNGKVFVSRDVKFIFDTFPFLQNSSPSIEQPISYPAESEPINLDDNVSTTDHDSPLIELQSSERFSPSNSSPHNSAEISNFVSILKRGTRVREPPIWMQDFIGIVQSTQLITPSVSITPPTFPYATSPSLSKSRVSYLFNLSMIKEPSSFREAIHRPK